MSAQKSPITTHVLDVSRGRPARALPIVLHQLQADSSWKELAHGVTDTDGRLATLLPPGAPVITGTYRLRFDTGAYFRASGTKTFYPYVEIVFEIAENSEHYHVPLLLSAFGYSTYRGS